MANGSTSSNRRSHGEVGEGFPLSTGVFNSVGALAAVFGPILVGGGAFRGGKQVVPPLPFVFGAWGLGFFMLGPYVALRNYVPEGDGEEAGPLEVLFVCI